MYFRSFDGVVLLRPPGEVPVGRVGALMRGRVMCLVGPSNPTGETQKIRLEELALDVAKKGKKHKSRPIGWRAIVTVVIMLAAMFAYVASIDESEPSALPNAMMSDDAEAP